MTARTIKKRPKVRAGSKAKATRARKRSVRKNPRSARGATNRNHRRSISDPKIRVSRASATFDDEASRSPLAKGTDALSLLRRDHQTARKLLSRLGSAKSADRQSALLERVESELKSHTQIEEEIFYPAFHDRARGKDDRQMYYEALEEHHAVDVILPEVKRAAPGTAEFSARAKVLKELVEHHADEEEEAMFPRARKIFGPGELHELGRKIAEKKKESKRSAGTLRSFLGFG